MLKISEVKTTEPETYRNELQEKVYSFLKEYSVSYERVDTEEAITMEDCADINAALNMETVKTLFLCNRQQTDFYLFITKGDKPFRSKDFSSALGISRVSFAPAELMKKAIGTKVDAATVFGCILDTENRVSVVFDKEILSYEYYGCSDGTTTGYMKLRTDDILHKLLPYAKHELKVIEV